jgi:hypothetical protein
MTIIAAVLVIALGAWYFNADQKIKTVVVNGNYLVYETVEDLQAASELVVIATPTGKQKSVVTGSGMSKNGWMLTEIRIDKVIKPDEKQEIKEGMTVSITEPYYIADAGIEPGKVMVIPEEYTAVQAGNQYVLFLAWDGRSKTYGVYTGPQGKFNIDGRDVNEDEQLEGANADLKQQVLAKYSGRYFPLKESDGRKATQMA